MGGGLDDRSRIAVVLRYTEDAAMSSRRILSRLWSLVWIDYSKVDEEFREELHDRGVLGLRIASIVAIALPTFAVVLLLPFGPPDYPRGDGWIHIGLVEEVSSVVVGVIGLLLSRTSWGRRHSRGLATAVGLMLGGIAMTDMVTSGGYVSSVFAASLALVLVIVAAVPLRPLSMLGFGLALVAMFMVSGFFDPTVGWPPPVAWLERLVILLAVSVLGAALRAMILLLHLREHESRAALAQSLEALRRTQANLIASKRAASQGRLAAALSHELNSPLSVLQSSSRVIERLLAQMAGHCGDPDAVARSLAGATEAANVSSDALGRISRLVDRFERFTHLNEDTAERRPVDVNGLLDDAVGVLAGGWRGRIRVTKDYSELPRVLAYPVGLSEVFGNVISNAASAIEGEGEIRLTTRYGKGYVWVQIADSGRGIDVDKLSTIFEPGFRVKDGRVRTGWGLFISRQIVHDHDGEFRIGSEPGRGTQVEICLPAGAEESG